MKTMKGLIDTRKGQKALILCTGSMVKKFRKEIDFFINRTKPFTIGINNITELWTPDYHLWTNNRRFRAFGKNINPKSTLLLGSNISLKVINEVICNRNYVVLERMDREGVPIDYRNGIIYGYHRTAGCAAITIAHLMGAKEINVVGMDGHTFNEYEKVLSGEKQHHFYDEDYIPYSQDVRVKKDKIVNGVLQNIKNYGVNFKILTPTKYEKFYDGNKLHGGK